jgi:hypothetical protein
LNRLGCEVLAKPLEAFSGIGQNRDIGMVALVAAASVSD